MENENKPADSLGALSNALEIMKQSMATIRKIAIDEFPTIRSLDNLEKERIRHQNRANEEAVKRDEAEAEIASLKKELEEKEATIVVWVEKFARLFEERESARDEIDQLKKEAEEKQAACTEWIKMFDRVIDEREGIKKDLELARASIVDQDNDSRIQHARNLASERDHYRYNYENAVKSHRQALKDLEIARAERGWIKCSDKMPDDCVDVLAVWWQGDRCTAYVRNGTWWYRGQMGLKAASVSPVGWQHLPEPPVGEGDDKEKEKDDRSDDRWFYDPNEGDRG